MTNKIPLVSVIMPMYNSAKFIPQTLESLCYQTMRDFEVVVIDDGSTDNSVEVVESFASRVGGGLNLHVIKLKKNTGNPGLPRNVGIQFARGKYIAFLDSDDLFTKTALEELSTLAEQYQAEVINTNTRFNLWNGEKKSVDAPEMTDFAELTNPKNFRVFGPPTPKKPVFETENLAEKIQFWISGKYPMGTSTNFCRRDFLIANQIHFANMYLAEDQIFKFACFCLSKKFLLVPNAVYIVRPRDNSIMRRGKNQSLTEHFRKRINTFVKHFDVFAKFMDGIKFFDEHPEYRYAVYDWIFLRRIGSTIRLYTANPLPVLNSIVKEEFCAESDNLVTASAYMFNTLNLYRLQLLELLQENDALRNELKKYQTTQ